MVLIPCCPYLVGFGNISGNVVWAFVNMLVRHGWAKILMARPKQPTAKVYQQRYNIETLDTFADWVVANLGTVTLDTVYLIKIYIC